MDPEKIELIIRRVVNEGWEFHWWVYLFAVILPFIGAYLGAYFKKRGEDQATKKNYDELLAQIKKTTEATEKIKTSLSKRNWITQQSWYLREKYYTGILESLYQIVFSLSDIMDLFHEGDSIVVEHEINKNPYYIEHCKICKNEFEKLNKIRGPSEIIISKKAIKALNDLDRKRWEFSFNTSIFAEESYKILHDSVIEAKKIILTEARLALEV